MEEGEDEEANDKRERDFPIDLRLFEILTGLAVICLLVELIRVVYWTLQNK